MHCEFTALLILLCFVSSRALSSQRRGNSRVNPRDASPESRNLPGLMVATGTSPPNIPSSTPSADERGSTIQSSRETGFSTAALKSATTANVSTTTTARVPEATKAKIISTSTKTAAATSSLTVKTTTLPPATFAGGDKRLSSVKPLPTTRKAPLSTAATSARTFRATETTSNPTTTNSRTTGTTGKPTTSHIRSTTSSMISTKSAANTVRKATLSSNVSSKAPLDLSSSTPPSSSPKEASTKVTGHPTTTTEVHGFSSRRTTATSSLRTEQPTKTSAKATTAEATSPSVQKASTKMPSVTTSPTPAAPKSTAATIKLTRRATTNVQSSGATARPSTATTSASKHSVTGASSGAFQFSEGTSRLINAATAESTQYSTTRTLKQPTTTSVKESTLTTSKPTSTTSTSKPTSTTSTSPSPTSTSKPTSTSPSPTSTSTSKPTSTSPSSTSTTPTSTKSTATSTPSTKPSTSSSIISSTSKILITRKPPTPSTLHPWQKTTEKPMAIATSSIEVEPSSSTRQQQSSSTAKPTSITSVTSAPIKVSRNDISKKPIPSEPPVSKRVTKFTTNIVTSKTLGLSSPKSIVSETTNKKLTTKSFLVSTSRTTTQPTAVPTSSNTKGHKKTADDQKTTAVVISKSTTKPNMEITTSNKISGKFSPETVSTRKVDDSKLHNRTPSIKENYSSSSPPIVKGHDSTLKNDGKKPTEFDKMGTYNNHEKTLIWVGICVAALIFATVTFIGVMCFLRYRRKHSDRKQRHEVFQLLDDSGIENGKSVRLDKFSRKRDMAITTGNGSRVPYLDESTVSF